METYQVFVAIGIVLSLAIIAVEFVAIRGKLRAKDRLISELRTHAPIQHHSLFLDGLTKLGPSAAESLSGLTDEDIKSLVEEIERTAQSLPYVNDKQRRLLIAPLSQPSELGRLRYLRDIVGQSQRDETVNA